MILLCLGASGANFRSVRSYNLPIFCSVVIWLIQSSSSSIFGIWYLFLNSCGFIALVSNTSVLTFWRFNLKLIRGSPLFFLNRVKVVIEFLAKYVIFPVVQTLV